MVFSELLKKKREAAGLTRAELAISAGLSPEFITGLETGALRNASFDNCYRISEALTRHTRQPFILQDLWRAARGQASPIRH